MADTQILLITCDNTSNNDTMIAELVNLLNDFPGPANQTQCFMHILNLIVKSIIRQFDLPQSKVDALSDEVMKELLSLAGNIEFEEEAMAGRDSEEGVGGEDNNLDGWIDERMLMTEEELSELDQSVEPVQ